MNAGEKAVQFIETHLRHTKGRWAGAPFHLRKWQRDIIESIFGPVDAEGNRVVRTAFIEIPRKNGKSELAAAVALKLLFADGEMGAEIYGAAADRDQASLVFNVAAQMVRQDAELSRRCKVIDSQKRIVVADRGSFYRAIPADAAGSHGFNAHGIIFDEVHTQKTRDLWDVLTSSTGARSQPLTFAITTAGYDRESICWELHEYASRVLSGTVADPTFYASIYAAPEEANWKHRRTWKACNPALGDFLNVSHLEMEAKRAAEMPAMQNTFRRLYLNQWTQQADRWIDLSLWDANAGAVDEERLRGRKCYGMLDLATVSDMTAWVLLFPREDDPEVLEVLPRFFCPKSRMTASGNRYRGQYAAWERQGHLKVTPGEATDYAFVKAQVIEDAKKFRMVDMNVDRLFQAHQIAMELAEEGIKVFGMGMGFASMAAPMAEFERRLRARKFRHGGNPILRWMADNVAVKQDPAGNLKPDKVESQGKIDGIIGVVGALDRVMRNEDKISVYEGRGVLAV